MAVDRGGLRYTIKVRDEFSKTTERFREEIKKSREAFRELKDTLASSLSSAQETVALKETAKALRDSTKAAKALSAARAASVKATVETAKAERALADATISKTSKLNNLVQAQKDAASIIAKNKTGTEEEAAIRQRVASIIVDQTKKLAALQILRQNDRGPQGLTDEEAAYKASTKAIFDARVELERLTRARKDNTNLQGQTAAGVAKLAIFEQNRALKETAALEAELARLKETRFKVDEKGRVVLSNKLQAEREYKNVLDQRAIAEERIRLLSERGLGPDGLTDRQRAVQAYNAELLKLSTQEERLNVIREKGEAAFATRSARVRAESAALEALINTKSKLLQIELASSVTDESGRSLSQLRAEEAVESRITKEKQRQAELELLASRGRGEDGLTADERAIRSYGAELEKLATQEARLAKIRDEGEDVYAELTARIRAEERSLQELIRTKARLIELELAERTVDDDGTTLAALRAREAAEARILRQKQRQIELQLLAQQGRGSDGLTAEERALRAYRAELDKLAEAEERLKLIRDDVGFAERAGRIRAEERAVKELVKAEEKLRLTRLEGSITTSGGRSLTDIRAEEAAESSIRREAERRLAAEKEIALRKARGLPISRALRDEAAGLAKETERTASAANRTIFSFRRLFLIFGAFEAVRGAVRNFNRAVVAGVKFNDTLEKAELSIAALITASTDLPGLLGQGTTAASQLGIAMNEARRQNELLRADSLRTTATYEELLQAFQVALAPGIAQGGSLDEVRKFTVQISQAASALGVAQNQLSEEIRNIVQGTINIRTTRIAASLGITNEDIRTAREAGVLFQFLEQRFDAFNEAGIRAQKTFSGLALRIRDAFQQVTGLASADLFDALKASLSEVFDILGEINDETGKFEPSPKAVKVFREIFDSLQNIVTSAEEFAKSFTFEEARSSAESIGQALETASEIAFSLVAGFRDGLDALSGPFAALQSVLGQESVGDTVQLLTQALVIIGAINAALAVMRGVGGAIVGIADIFRKGLRAALFAADKLGIAFGVIRKGAVAALPAVKSVVALLLGPFLPVILKIGAAVGAAFLVIGNPFIKLGSRVAAC